MRAVEYALTCDVMEVTQYVGIPWDTIMDNDAMLEGWNKAHKQALAESY